MHKKTVDAKTMYIIKWILDESDEERRNIDPRTINWHELREMAQTALEAWDGGARGGER